MAIEASCSHCTYSRAFAPELGGRFYRCPKCGEGVVAVPRASDEVSQTWRADHESWIERSAARLGVARPSDTGGVESVEDAALETDASEDSDAPPRPPNFKGEIASARKILVECGLCHFMVRIPPEFFGKTVHCPNCAGDTMFTESVLEPVKDELIDRLYLESRERSALGTAGQEPEPETLAARRPFALGIGIGIALLILIGSGYSAIQNRRRTEATMRALEGGWRYAADDVVRLLHEPWCRDLPPQFDQLPADRLDERLAEGYRKHDCR